MTREALTVIEAQMRAAIKAEAAENGIDTTRRAIRPGVRRTAKRVGLLGELIQMQTSGYFNLTRWAAAGIGYEDLRGDAVSIIPDRHREPVAAKVRTGLRS